MSGGAGGYFRDLLFLFSWSISDQINLTSSDMFNNQEAWLIGFFTSFLLLSSIIFHQIFHTYICLIEGVKIKKITFFFLGAVLQIEKDCQSSLGNIMFDSNISDEKKEQIHKIRTDIAKLYNQDIGKKTQSLSLLKVVLCNINKSCIAK